MTLSAHLELEWQVVEWRGLFKWCNSYECTMSCKTVSAIGAISSNGEWILCYSEII